MYCSPMQKAATSRSLSWSKYSQAISAISPLPTITSGLAMAKASRAGGRRGDWPSAGRALGERAVALPRHARHVRQLVQHLRRIDQHQGVAALAAEVDQPARQARAARANVGDAQPPAGSQLRQLAQDVGEDRILEALAI